MPEFQREYAWGKDEVNDFFTDLAKALQSDTYFLGLIILTGEGHIKDVVDGQQRLLTLTLLSAALYHEARRFERNALAGRIQSSFLRSIDFGSDEELPRLELSSESDNQTLQLIIDHPASDLDQLDPGSETVSSLLLSAYRTLSSSLERDLGSEPFKRLGLWADFLSNKLYLANFVHPDPASAYRVFEVINTRGKELTTADLLKNFVLSQTAEKERPRRYDEWQAIARTFGTENASTFVQFIRHAVTAERGYVEPRDLYDELANGGAAGRVTPEHLMRILHRALPLYLQMMDPTASGPAEYGQLSVFSVLQRLKVISVRPILLSISASPNATIGMQSLLRLVVRRVVAGNLGTGNVERRFGQAALRITAENQWEDAIGALADLNPGPEEFQSQVHHRNLNRNVLTVVRQSTIQRTITPEPEGYLYFIRPRDSDWPEQDVDRVTYWATTIGNTILANEARRPIGSSTWEGFNTALLPGAVEGEWVESIRAHSTWNVEAIADIGEELSRAAKDVWYE